MKITTSKGKLLLAGTVFVLMIFWGILSKSFFVEGVSLGNNGAMTPGDLNEETKILQEFRPKHSELNRIGIKFATYEGLANQGTVLLELYDEELNNIYAASQTLENIADGTHSYFIVDKILEKGALYYWKITVQELKGGVPPTVWIGGNGVSEHGLFYYNDITLPETLDVIYHYRKFEPSDVYGNKNLYFLVFWAFGIAFLCGVKFEV